MCVYKDSTSLEKYLRKVIDIADDDLDMPILVNCSGYGGYWQVCEDKLFHELQFDQLLNMINQSAIGFTLILQFFSRKVFFHKQNSLILNIQKRPINPSDRRPLAMKIFRWILRPDLFSDILERVNVTHFGIQKYLFEITSKMRLSYPMISYLNLIVDHRSDKIYKIENLEQELSNCLY